MASTSRPSSSPVWNEIRITASDRLAVKASRRLMNDEQLFAELGQTRLRIELGQVPLWRGNHVEVRQLCGDFAQYLYLPRTKTEAKLNLQDHRRTDQS